MAKLQSTLRSDDRSDLHDAVAAILNLLAEDDWPPMAKDNILEACSSMHRAATREREMSDLHEVAEAITSKLDMDELVSVLESRIKSLVDADACSLLIHSSDGSPEMEIIGPGIQLVRRHSIPEHVDACEIAADRVASTGQPVILSNVPCCKYCRYKELICTSGFHHMLSVPMRTPDQLIGAVNAFRLNKQPFGPSDLRKLSIIAGAAAIALENARAFHRERDMADKLQQGIQPDSGFNLPGFSVGCGYVPANARARVGGDFYDIVDVGHGKAGIVIADIAGKGIDAAVYTAMVRFTLRGLMLAGLEPAEVLARLNDAVCSFVPDEVFVTLFYGLLDVRSKRMEYANAGHDHPIIFANNQRELMECDTTGRALGMVPGDTYESKSIVFQPHDLIVLYTDGITEARNGKRFFGIRRLSSTIKENAGGDASEMVEAVFAKVRSFAKGGLRDDAGMLVIKALPD